MFDKIIEVLLGSAEKIKKLDEKTQKEITKYNNTQIKKAALVCYALGTATSVFITKLI